MVCENLDGYYVVFSAPNKLKLKGVQIGERRFVNAYKKLDRQDLKNFKERNHWVFDLRKPK